MWFFIFLSPNEIVIFGSTPLIQEIFNQTNDKCINNKNCFNFETCTLKGNRETANLSLLYYKRKKWKLESSSLSNISNKFPDYYCKSARLLSIDLTEFVIRSPFISTSSLQSLAITPPFKKSFDKIVQTNMPLYTNNFINKATYINLGNNIPFSFVEELAVSVSCKLAIAS